MGPGFTVNPAISIHALLAESDSTLQNFVIGLDIFLSTLSLRRATGSLSGTSSKMAISIHALLAESDNAHLYYHSRGLKFLSTLSLRRATSIDEHLRL